eukprot:CAMPEP_0174828580 /NCGR_PEP_ID=MMETSP1114-20130205/1416_1 /TAXON_ID=312471 /ORGANISM="Neobodo designis, Strain CCAP 1951/1" /LENGTH=578 /DNA_ID=CAMNT_0016062301 /DNA_START=27 /DNA_END=1760 /DNA_ORIENTATION=+
MNSSPQEVIRGAVEPFGEYVRRVFSIRPFHHRVDLANPTERLSVVVPCAATLFLYGTEEKLAVLLQVWQRSTAENDAANSLDEDGNELLTSFAAPSAVEFEDHVRHQLQCCLNVYFSSNWDRSREVVSLNNSYRDYIAYMYDRLARCSDGAEMEPLQLTEPPTPIREAARFEADNASPLTCAASLHGAINSLTPKPILILFHAPFSDRSLSLLDATRRVVSQDSDGVIFAVINVASQVDVVRTFDVDRYPTLILLQPSVDKTPPLALGDFERHVYPEAGAVEEEAVKGWLSCGGRSVPRLVTPTGPHSLATMPRDEVQLFASRREEHSNKVIQRRLGCNDDSCIKPRRATVEDPPRFIFLGGGMAAGKTTSTASLAATTWWKKFGDGVVIVNADEFKYTDEGMRGLRDPTLHSYSTKKAEELLVSAVNSTRDVVFDGTMMWAPFVFQVINMVRGSWNRTYKNGRGWVPDEGIEEYFVEDCERETPRVPYTVELVGAFADPARTVPRAIVRELRTGRNVPTRQQLKSYKLFAQHFAEYVSRLDVVVLYNTDVMVDIEAGEVPPVAARKDRDSDSLQVVD